MHEAFEAATQKYLEEKGLSESTSQESNKQSVEETQVTNTESDQSASSDNLSQEAKEAIWELKETGKFRYNGKEYTAKDLEDLQKGSLRMSDYTKKTQGLSEERKSLESERKFYENLYYDLSYVKENPSAVNQFLQTYPEQFHKYLKGVLSNDNQSGGDNNSQYNQRQTYPDVELLGRVNKLESFYLKQETDRAKAEITQVMGDLSKKYPDALQDAVLAKAMDLYSSGTKLTSDVWENIFKTDDARMKARDKQKFGDMVKKQVSANNKAKDVDAGGGTPGRAPFKPNRIEDVRNKLLSDIENRR